jgi:hypothetical protein
MANYTTKVLWPKDLRDVFNEQLMFIKEMANKMFWVQTRKRRLDTDYAWYAEYDILVKYIHQIDTSLFVLNFEYDTDEDCEQHFAYVEVIEDLMNEINALEIVSQKEKFIREFRNATLSSCGHMWSKLKDILEASSNE